ncbi:MAG: protein phosphatase 2C domain-containing protein [Gammaproteobacteria bacterium]|nr:protein phosphatase 2C domain-containing protein [Gammaproteobacteria bacterium]MBU2069134.1 protein phosphatase 2C domain-containing protein [Gammaproteobacteria bacterium]MBU2182611.1 protein phosphatase 2C domain-containing protein [Gammaproteobacteria bacterium]MBU2206538.1 protein phosphatase 2C domain-containing protein [Gammaproteobacteria bacterium]
MSASELQLNYSSICEAGIKPANEDAVAQHIPSDPHLLTYKGACFALADGVSTAEAGQQASSRAVSRFCREYSQTPDSWSVAYSAQQLLATINNELYELSHQFVHEQKGYLTTFTALVLKSQTAHFFHIGDSRLYHWRDGVLVQLSQDHTTVLSEQRQFLSRALGMDAHVELQQGSISIKTGDRFLLCSDGISDFISVDELQRQLSAATDLDATAAQLTKQALAQGSDDNLSLILLEITALPEQSLDDLNQHLTALPFPPALSPGMKLDGYKVLQELFASSRSHLYLVEDEASGASLVLKCPSLNYDDDALYIDRFIREEWIGLRIESDYVVKVVRQSRPRTFLYYLMEYLPGQSLEQWFERQPKPLKPALAIKLVKQIAEGLKAFHRMGAIHQDLKPGNIIYLDDGSLKIVDFGSVFVAGLAEIYSPLQHDAALGTAAYSDPHYLLGHNSGVQGDIYALATIAYELFSGGHLPYGNAVEECRTAADYDKLRYLSASQFNPVIPTWFDRALQKGVSLDLSQRYQSINQLLTDLQQPNPAFLHEEVKQQHKTNPLLFWQLLSGFWFITLLLVVWLFLLRR